MELDQHLGHVSEPVAMSAYREAIVQVVRPGDVVADLGAGTGILSEVACRAGASRVYAVDPSAMIELARETAGRDPAGRIRPIRRPASDADPPERSDVIIASMLDSFGIEGGLLAVARDARERLLRTGGTFVPAELELFSAPAELPEWYAAHVDCWNEERAGSSVRAVRAAAASAIWRASVPTAALLGDPMPAGRFVLGSIESADFRGSLTWSVRKAGRIHAIAGWCRVTFSAQVARTNSPFEGAPLPWRQRLFPLAAPLDVAPGDVVDVDLAMHQTDDEGQQWSWRGDVRRSGSVIGKFAQSAEWGVRGIGLTPSLGRNATDPSVARSIAAEALGLFDGVKTITEICQRLARRHCDVFREAGSCSAFVKALSERWG